MKNTELKSILLEKYRGSYCESCVFPASGAALDLHHALIHDQKKFHNILTVEENCVLVCRDCHPFTNGHKFREEVLERKIKTLGIDRMRAWRDSLDDRLKRHDDYKWIEEALK
jgi:hypothetical protein